MDENKRYILQFEIDCLKRDIIDTSVQTVKNRQLPRFVKSIDYST